jgi:hypothetical protein
MHNIIVFLCEDFKEIPVGQGVVSACLWNNDTVNFRVEFRNNGFILIGYDGKRVIHGELVCQKEEDLFCPTPT